MPSLIGESTPQTENSGRMPSSLTKFVVRVIDAFGPRRVMWGSNYPVCGDAEAYQRDLAQLTSGGWGLGPREVAQIAHGPAAQLWFDES